MHWSQVRYSTVRVHARPPLRCGVWAVASSVDPCSRELCRKWGRKYAPFRSTPPAAIRRIPRFELHLLTPQLWINDGSLRSPTSEDLGL